MTNQMKIPDHLQRAFHRLIDYLPDPLKDDDHTKEVILTYLKFGDEKLARHRIEIIKTSFRGKTLKESSEIQTLLDLYSDGSDTSESDLSEGDNLEFPTD
jgi:N12 class adenine-specific DNA methylase